MSPELRNRDVPSVTAAKSAVDTAAQHQEVTSGLQSVPKRRGRPARNTEPHVEQLVGTPEANEATQVIDEPMEFEEEIGMAGEQMLLQETTTPMGFMDTMRSQVSPTLPPMQSASNTPGVSDNETIEQSIQPPSPKKKRGRLVKGSVRHAAALPTPPTPFKVGNRLSNAISKGQSSLFFSSQEYKDQSIYSLQKPFEILKMNPESNHPSPSRPQSSPIIPKATATSRPEGKDHDVLGGLLTSMSAQAETRINSKPKANPSQEPMSVDQNPLMVTPGDRVHSDFIDDLTIAASAAGVPVSALEGLSTSPSTQQMAAKPAKKSKFTKEEHLKFMQIGELLKTNPSLVSEKDRTLYTKMSREITEEKDEFVQWQKSQMRDSDIMNKVDGNVARILDQHYALEQERVIKLPCNYEFYKSINVFSKVLNGHEPILLHKLLLERQGTVCRCDLPSKLPMMVPFKDVYFASRPSQDVDGYIGLPDVGISQDPNIPKMIIENGVNVVATSKSLSSIVALEKDRESALDIPFRIAESQLHDTNPIKTVYIDDPLTDPIMDNRQRAQIVYDAVFKEITLNQSQRQSIKQQAKTPSDDTAHKNGTGTVIGSTIQSPSLKVDTVPDTEYPTSSSGTELDDKSSESSSTNTIYNLWTFGDINLLVRWHADGYINENDKTGTNNETRMVSLKSKVDFHIHTGHKEIMTSGDRARHWMTSYLQGHAPIFEGRIDPTTNQLLRIERKEMVDIMGDRWRPVQESEMLRQLLIKLRSLDVGEYLLRYSKRNHIIDIWKHNKDATKGYNLHQRYRDIKIDHEATYIPAWSGSKEQIPFTFPVASSSNKKSHKHGARRSGFK